MQTILFYTHKRITIFNPRFNLGSDGKRTCWWCLLVKTVFFKYLINCRAFMESLVNQDNKRLLTTLPYYTNVSITINNKIDQLYQT